MVLLVIKRQGLHPFYVTSSNKDLGEMQILGCSRQLLPTLTHS